MSTRKVNGRMIDEFVAPLGYFPPAPITGGGCQASAQVTRPANQTQYANGDAIGDDDGSAIIAWPALGPAGGLLQIETVRLVIHSGTVPTGLTTDPLRLHLYAVEPTAIADNAAWDLVAADRAKYIDFIQLPAATDLGSTVISRVNGAGVTARLEPGSTTLYGVLTTTSAVTFAEASTVLDLRIAARVIGV